MDEYIDHWYIHKTEHDYVTYFMDWWKQDLKDMMEKDYNHPSVVLYSTGNEVSETAQEKGIALTKELTDYLHGLDPTRPVTCGVNIFFNFLSSIGFGVYSDEKAKKEAEKVEKKKQAGDKSNKKKAVGSETFCKDAYKFYELAKMEPRLVGDFVWAGMDYLGEVGIGAWEYSDYAPHFGGGPGWVSAGSGRIDLTGKLLGEACYTRVALGQERGPYIAVCPVNHTGDKHSPSAWKMSNAIPSWSWNGCGGKDADVEVYARAARVELFVNGKSVGVKNMKKDCIARFRCTYEDGVLLAASYDAAGRVLGRCVLHTASSKTELRAVPEQASVKSGHLSYIRLQYTDEDGIVKPLNRGILNVEVTGGKLLGLGSACPYNEIGYLTGKTDTYFGEALAVIQAGEAGTIELTVADGRYTGKAVVEICQNRS